MNNTNKIGYSNEEDYFYNHNRKLIEERRKSLNEERVLKSDTMTGNNFWMKCPKCGSKLQETEISGITIEKCEGCEGIYLDNGELSLIMDAEKKESFFDSLHSFLKGS